MIWKVVDPLTERFFSTLGRFRAARGFHPRGAAFTARLGRTETSSASWTRSVFGATGRREGAVRLSKGAGMPDPLPDVLGLALKLPVEDGCDALDLLLASSHPARGLRHLLVPALNVGKTTFSSILPFEAPDAPIVIGARPIHHRGRCTIDSLLTAYRPNLSFELASATLGGPWQAFATLEVGERLDVEAEEVLAFDPFIVPSALRPIGRLNRLRKPAYAASQRGRAVEG